MNFELSYYENRTKEKKVALILSDKMPKQLYQLISNKENDFIFADLILRDKKYNVTYRGVQGVDYPNAHWESLGYSDIYQEPRMTLKQINKYLNNGCKVIVILDADKMPHQLKIM